MPYLHYASIQRDNNLLRILAQGHLVDAVDRALEKYRRFSANLERCRRLLYKQQAAVRAQEPPRAVLRTISSSKPAATEDPSCTC